MVRILGIETSCDETAVGIVEDGRTVLGNAVASSLELHRPYGGVIPEIACRAHVETIWDVMTQALDEARLRSSTGKPVVPPRRAGGETLSDPTPGSSGWGGVEGSLEHVDAVAVTQGPGLPGALLVGLIFAKGLALSLDRPLIPVNHLAAHLYAGQMTESDLAPPYIGLVVSGGHTLLCVVHADARYELLGETKDDAVGEAFDKVAKLLGLGYPGGPLIDRLSDEGQAAQVVFPRSSTKQAFDFSFSGLKTAVYQYVRKQTQGTPRGTGQGAGGRGHESEDVRSQTEDGRPSASSLEHRQIADIAAGFQEAAVDILLTKTLRASQRTGISQIVVGGGVASNRRLRERFAQEAAAKKLRVVFPPPKLCVDNGAMIAGVAYPLLQRGRVASLAINADPNLCLSGTTKTA